MEAHQTASFEIRTVIFTKSLPSPILEETWFPGYPWVVLHCSSCLTHLGWRLEKPGRIPSLFYGLVCKRLVEKENDSPSLRKCLLVHFLLENNKIFISFCFVDSTPKKFK